jgi:hypothetical protein
VLSREQIDALHVVARHFGWEERATGEMGTIAWAAFHYYFLRLKEDDNVHRSQSHEDHSVSA